MLKILELFGGIGACTQALKRLGIDFEISDYVEIDKYAVKSYNVINGTNFEPQDITKWNKQIDVDLIMHGSPCQDFSIAGKQAGGDEDSGTRSSLMYETIRIVERLYPKYVVWENVKNLLSKKHKHNFDSYLEKLNQLGYNNYYQVLNAKDYGIPQNRERVYTISIRKDIDNGTFIFPEKEELKLRLKDMLEDEVDEKYYLSDKMINYIVANNTKWTGNNNQSIINKSIASTINTGEGSRRCDASNYVSNKLQDDFDLKIIKNFEISIKNANKKGYDIAIDGDSVNLQQPNSTTRRGRVGHQVSQTLQCNNSIGVIVIGNYMPSNYDSSRIVDNEGLAPTVKENHGTVTATQDHLRIRKLTPKECWRLMGFSDESFEKAEKVNSNTQLYKQAGNSIVVDVLYKIFKNLLKD